MGDRMPGVPAAGHVTPSGFWHNGAERNCHRTPCAEARATPLEVGDGVVYHPRPGVQGEDGVVTGLSSNGTMAFVRYADQHPGAPGRATLIRQLTRTSGASIRGGA